MKRILWILVLFLVSCSKVEVAYDWAPRFITNYIDEQFDLSSERYTQLKKSIETDLKANKELIKTEVLKNMNAAIAQIPNESISDEALDAFIQEMQASQKKIVYALRPSFEVFTRDLSREEFAHFQQELKERWQKYDERLKDEEKLKKRFKKRFEENMESCFDDVTEEQRKIYENYLNENWSRLKIRPQRRQALLAEFEKQLAQKDELLSWLLKLYANEPDIKTAEQKQFDEAALRAARDLIKKLWPTLTKSQKEYFSETLTEFKQEIEKL